MRLPEYLATAIEQVSPGGSSSTLTAASRELTQRYKSADFATPAVHTFLDRSAYLTVRFSATFAANIRVLSELRRLAPDVEISSLLDLGASPGTSLFAAAEIFPSLASATLLEADPHCLHLGHGLRGVRTG